MAVSTLNATVSINGVPFEFARARPSFTAEVIDTTPVGHTFRRSTMGFQEGALELELFFDSAVHEFVRANMAAGTIQTLVVTWTTGDSVTGSAAVTAWSIDVAPNAVNHCTASLLFTNSAITHS